MAHRPKQFGARLTFNVPAELRTELEAAAQQSGELISDVARGALVAWATARVVERGGPAAAAAPAGNPQTKTEQRT